MVQERKEYHGRAMMIMKDTFGTIIIKDKMSDSFDTLPRPVKHVGSKPYILSIWNDIIKNQKYLKDQETIETLFKKDKPK